MNTAIFRDELGTFSVEGVTGIEHDADSNKYIVFFGDAKEEYENAQLVQVF